MHTVEHAIIVKKSDSGKAILVEAAEFKKGEMWIPLSVVHDDSEIWREGDVGALGLKEWWAEKEGLL